MSSTLESFPAEVEEIRVPVSPKMRGIQEALVQILDMCLKVLYGFKGKVSSRVQCGV